MDNKLKNRKRPQNVSQTPKVKTICKYPQDLSDASANWKRLSLQMKDNKNKGFYRKGKINNKEIEPKGDPKTKIWFDGVDKCLIQSSMADSGSGDQNKDQMVKQNSFRGLTQIVGMDCEMVGTGSDATNSMLARVSIVNFFGHCIYDKYVKPMEEITDYRTAVSGIRPKDLVNAPDLKTVQKEVNEILEGRTVVGHAIHNDFKALMLSHPKNKIRDTSRYFRKLFGGRNPALKKLSETVLGIKVQAGEHDSVEDARVAMRLFTIYKKKWESDLKRNKSKHLKNK